MKAKRWDEVTLNDIMGVLTDAEKEDLCFRLGLRGNTINRMSNQQALMHVVNQIKVVCKTDDLKLLYYGRTLLAHIERYEGCYE